MNHSIRLLEASQESLEMNQCSICGSVMDRLYPPYAGQCGHSYCFTCIEEIIDRRAPCPDCEAVGSFKRIIRNYYAIELLQHIENLEHQLQHQELVCNQLLNSAELAKMNRDDFLFDARVILRDENFGTKLTWRKTPWKKFCSLFTRLRRPVPLTRPEEEEQNLRVQLLERQTNIQRLVEENDELQSCNDQWVAMNKRLHNRISRIVNHFHQAVNDRSDARECLMAVLQYLEMEDHAEAQRAMSQANEAEGWKEEEEYHDYDGDEALLNQEQAEGFYDHEGDKIDGSFEHNHGNNCHNANEIHEQKL